MVQPPVVALVALQLRLDVPLQARHVRLRAGSGSCCGSSGGHVLKRHVLLVGVDVMLDVVLMFVEFVELLVFVVVLVVRVVEAGVVLLLLGRVALARLLALLRSHRGLVRRLLERKLSAHKTQFDEAGMRMRLNQGAGCCCGSACACMFDCSAMTCTHDTGFSRPMLNDRHPRGSAIRSSTAIGTLKPGSGISNASGAHLRRRLLLHEHGDGVGVEAAAAARGQLEHLGRHLRGGAQGAACLAAVVAMGSAHTAQMNAHAARLCIAATQLQLRIITPYIICPSLPRYLT